jgi:hypothetical protein
MTIEIDYDSIPRSYRDSLELMQREGETGWGHDL